MAHDPVFPLTASAWRLLAILAGCLVLFHFVFLRLWRIGKVGWKRVDYVWLGIAALALFSGAADVRRLIAASIVETERVRLQGAYERLRDKARFMTGVVVCREFVRAESLPIDLERIQRQHDEACEFASQLVRTLPNEPPEKLDAGNMPERPHVTDRFLLEIFAGLDQQLTEYREARGRFDEIQAARDLTQGEKVFATIWPLLLAIALALRITKVSGEIHLEA